MKDTKTEAILPTHIATSSPSKGRSNTSTLCVSISLLFLSVVGLLLVHQNIQLDGRVRCMKNVVGKVVMVLNMMNNKVAEVEMDVEILRDDMEMELYDETSTPTTTDDYFEDLINIDENGEFVIIHNEEEENENGDDDEATEGKIEDVTKNGEFEVINEEYATKIAVMEVLEKVDIEDEVNYEKEKYLREQSFLEQEEVVV